MTPPERKTRPIKLPVSDWSVLESIACELKCMPRGGINPGKPSVTTMLRLITRGELAVKKNVKVAE